MEKWSALIQKCVAKGKAATSQSQMLVYAIWESSKNPIQIFEYHPDGSGKRPANFLKDFSDYLVTDGYATYNQLTSVMAKKASIFARYPPNRSLRYPYKISPTINIKPR